MELRVYSKSYEMCGKKRGYSSDIQAACESGRQMAKEPNKMIRWYHCPLCRLWHLTHKERR